MKYELRGKGELKEEETRTDKKKEIMKVKSEIMK
jgi:hypothetical protein